MTTVELRNLKKHYKQTDVIHGVSLSINQGELVVIVGPSGCGKSTLLRMIAGLESVTAGEIKINDKVINHLPPKKRDIAMVFQNYALYPHMTVYENIAYGLKMRGIKRDEIQSRVYNVAETLQLSDYLKRKPKALSGGQRQRVAMGRAIIRRPALFLFDEPLSNLDAKLRVDMRLEIHRLQKELGTTSIYVTHDQTEAMTLADKLVVLNQGRIEQIGKPLEIYGRPATKFVAQFIGTPAMNFIPAVVNKEGDGVVLSDEQVLPLIRESLSFYKNKSVTVGLRPEAIKIASSKNEDQFRVRIETVEDLGSDTIVYGRMLDKAHRLVVKLPGHVRTYPGEVMTLAVRPGNIHLFDDETGRQLL